MVDRKSLFTHLHARLRARASPCQLPACTHVQHPRICQPSSVARRHPLASLPLVIAAPLRVASFGGCIGAVLAVGMK